MVSLLPSCAQEGSRPVEDSLLVELLADLHLAEARSATDAVAGPTRDSVLAAHGVDHVDLRETLEWYAEHPNEYLGIYDRVLNRLNQQFDRVYEQRRSAELDTLGTVE